MREEYMMYLNGGNVGFVMKVVVSEDTVIVIADICRLGDSAFYVRCILNPNAGSETMSEIFNSTNCSKKDMKKQRLTFQV
jgi:hypothetical protein